MDIINRAIRAFTRDKFAPQPSESDSTIEESNGRKYVVLRNVNGLLAVYRVGAARLHRVRPDDRMATQLG